ncbi:hypothetical protein AHFPHNDE_04171 [Pseudomonas sp. MM227]|uniref:DUF3617 domain-containing protein n=2 Tax=unclassified Pseudomonas TaxID=196821 RepID=UPI000F039EEA|nr:MULTISPECIES: DUF3617 domain-containing protein [unclassified Pseudomonas]MBD8603967.1 DUF3617 domain-containing protein [Pseudomonas sp. CFBP 8771]MBD8624443.1 DUF3617 domain-containing protein [Pseudomonas sp. CFBP 13727]MBD8732785.1 DUF3617 domain-containing protein [Pseudomonas sp. CFBP 13710]CAI3790452.1 hypothetical protein AHFPHNDE_04171 [Pseudomonas sp. MM227]
MRFKWPMAALVVGLSATGAQAQMLQPGLWEMTTSNMQVDGKPLPDMQVMLGQLKMLPPEQRAMMEGVLANQGITVGGNGIRSCLTPEQVKTNDIPLQDAKSGCTQKITERNGNVWKFQFSCPKAQGTGQAQFLSDREFLTTVNGTFNASGVAQKGSMNTRAVWLGNNCGSVKPRT